MPVHYATGQQDPCHTIGRHRPGTACAILRALHRNVISTCGTGGFAQFGQPSPCNAAGSAYQPTCACLPYTCPPAWHHFATHKHSLARAKNMFVAVTLQTWRVCFTAQHSRRQQGPRGYVCNHPCPSRVTPQGAGWAGGLVLGKVLQTLTVLLASGECCRGATALAAVHCVVSRSHAMLSILRVFSTQRPVHAVASLSSSDDTSSNVYIYMQSHPA